ncbi:MAG TPA: GntR family transcriptional regulator [Thermodesulfobacteriota bacterium]|nr:GntR family transcriptional regulator [Thermodesulfobacteriota bacterium]
MRKLGTTHENLDHKVYKALKAMILGQQLTPGSKIYQEKIADDLGVSRTPVVNALKKLEQERLIVAVPRRGFYVRRFSADEMIRIFELREVLEGLAARRASIRSTGHQRETLQGFFRGIKISDRAANVEAYADEDRRFHNYLIEAAGDEILSGILEMYNLITSSYLVGSRGGLVRPPRETLPEHLAIIDAIRRHDPEKAEKTARIHLRRSREKLMEEIGKERPREQSRKGDGGAG